MAELMGRETGYCLGRGGTQHVASMAHGFLGTNGITGGGIPIATGAALSAAATESAQAEPCRSETTRTQLTARPLNSSSKPFK